MVYKRCRGEQPSSPDPEAAQSGSASPPRKESTTPGSQSPEPEGASSQVAGEEEVVKSEGYEPAVVRYCGEGGGGGKGGGGEGGRGGRWGRGESWGKGERWGRGERWWMEVGEGGGGGRWGRWLCPKGSFDRKGLEEGI